MIKNKRTKTILGTGLILVLITVGIIVFFVRKSSETNKDIDPVETINYTEATDQEKEETAQNKEKVIAETEAQNNQTKPSTNQSSEIKPVTPVIGYIGQAKVGAEVQANGYVPSIIEKDGMCTLTLTKGSAVVSDTRVALDNVQDTSCGLLVIPKSKLSNGAWVATLGYKSAKYSGTSEKITVDVK